MKIIYGILFLLWDLSNSQMATIGMWFTIFGGIAGLVVVYEFLTKKNTVTSWLERLFFPGKVTRRAIKAVLDKVDNLSDDIKDVKKEVKTNGGSSVKDSINRVENKVNIIDERQQEIKKTGELVKGRQTAIYYLNPSPMFITNKKGNLEYVNKAWKDLFSINEDEEVFGLGWLNKIIPEDQIKMAEETHIRMMKNPSPYSGEMVFKNAKDSNIMIKAHVESKVNKCYNEETKENEVVEIIGYLSKIEIFKINK